MAKPQLENGFVRIATELFEALHNANLSGREFQIVLAIMRRTYGWNKKQDAISLKWLQDNTGISRRSWILKLLASLEKQQIVLRTPRPGQATEYAINKNYEQWGVSHRRDMSQRRDMSHTQVGEGVSCMRTGGSSCMETMNRHVLNRQREKQTPPAIAGTSTVDGETAETAEPATPGGGDSGKKECREYLLFLCNGGRVDDVGWQSLEDMMTEHGTEHTLEALKTAGNNGVRGQRVLAYIAKVLSKRHDKQSRWMMGWSV